MNKFKLLLVSLVFLCTYNVYAEGSVNATLTKTEYWVDDTLNFKIEPGFDASIYAAAFHVGYSSNTLEFLGFTADSEDIFLADTYVSGGEVVAGYTSPDKNNPEVIGSVVFSFKVKTEGKASITLKSITTVDLSLTEVKKEINKPYQVNIINPVQPPSDNKPHNNGGGGISLPNPAPVPIPTPIPTPTPQAAELPFGDISADFWAGEYIGKLYEKNIISKSDNFRPDDKISRAEFIKLVTLAFEIPPVYTAPTFSDCEKGAWYSSYISAASAAEIIKGDGGKFRPDEYISRQDVCVILSRVINYTDTCDLSFTDSEGISDYAADAVKKLASAGIVNGLSDGSFGPLLNTTRAQATKMICLTMEVE